MNEQQGSGPVEQQFDRSRRRFLGGALGAAAAGPLLAAATVLASLRSGCRGGARTQDQARAGRLRRARKLACRAVQAGRRLRDARRGRLLPGRGGQVRRRLGRSGSRRFSGLSGYQKADRQRRGSRGPRSAALLPPRAGRCRSRGGRARLHGEAGGGGRARLPQGRRPGKGGDGETPGALRRLPDAHRPVQYPGGRADPQQARWGPWPRSSRSAFPGGTPIRPRRQLSRAGYGRTGRTTPR